MIGIYFVPNVSPDFEGISFLLEDGTFERIGKDEIYTPSVSDHTILSSRLIGLSVKFGYNSLNMVIVPGIMGIIID